MMFSFLNFGQFNCQPGPYYSSFNGGEFLMMLLVSSFAPKRQRRLTPCTLRRSHVTQRHHPEDQIRLFLIF